MCETQFQHEVMDERRQDQEYEALDVQAEMDKDRDVKCFNDPLFLMMVDLMRGPMR